jgi:glycine hydroxymethyltransferase
LDAAFTIRAIEGIVVFAAEIRSGGSDDIYQLIESELRSQESTVNLIAAANYLSPGVQAAMHPALQNIHTEGYPGYRYHEGQTCADAIEEIAIARAKAVFGAEHVNVQPYRGTSAVLAALLAVLELGDVVMGFECSAGGHYSTGGSVHLVSQLFRVEPYDVCPDTGLLDYDRIEARARRVRPRAIVCGDTSYPRAWDFARLAELAERVGAVLIADVSQTVGLIAGGVVPSPVPYADIVVAATYKTLRGPRAGIIMCRARHRKAVDRAIYPLLQGGTNIATLAGLAVALGEAGTPAFAAYARRVVDNARTLAVELSARHFDLVTGGTDNHACLIDLRARELPGRVAAAALARIGILANANQVPFDPFPPRSPSGLRIGSAAATSLGMDVPDMRTVAAILADVLDGPDADEATALLRRAAVRELRGRFPSPSSFAAMQTSALSPSVR